MSEVAANSYIHKHQVDSRKGLTTLKDNRVIENLLIVQDGRMVDSVAQASKGEAMEIASSLQGVKLPSPKKGRHPGQSYYTELAIAFGKVFKAMGDGLQVQTSIFTQEQKENQTNALCVLDAQSNAVIDRKKADAQREKAEKAEKKAEKFSKIMTFVGIGIAISAVLASVVIAAAPAISAGFASLQASFSATTETAMSASGEWIEMSTFSQGTEEAMGSAGTAVAEGTTEAPVATESGVAETDQASSFLKELGKRSLSALSGAAMSSPQLVNYIESKTTAKAEKLLAHTQKEIGENLSKVALMQAGFKIGQQKVQQHSSVIQDLTQQLGEVVSTYGDMLKSVRAATSSFAQAI